MSTFELPSMAHFSKRRFGNYRLVRLLGKGGFASVYLGKHIHLGTQAAIKVLRAWLTDTDVDKFYTEARIGAPDTSAYREGPGIWPRRLHTVSSDGLCSIRHITSISPPE